MRYLGGKYRLRKQISQIINLTIDRQTDRQTVFVSLFCGACNVESLCVADRRILNDKNKYVIAFHKAMQKGFILPDVVTKQDFEYIRNHKDENPALTGYVGFQCSFFGKFFHGYAGEEYARQGHKNTIEIANGLKGCEFTSLDYRDVHIPDGSVVYCDPPYADSTGWYATGSFNNDEFWEYMRKISEKNIVLISERKAPEDFYSIWSKPYKSGVRSNSDISKGIQGQRRTETENLFVLYKYKDILN